MAYFTDDVLDSRDVIDRIDELSDEITYLTEALDDEDYTDEANRREDRLQLEENEEELKILQDFANECEDYSSDWKHGAQLINENYFIDYARDFVEECYSGDTMPSWVEVDWEATADNMRIDYAEIQFEDEVYLVR